MSNIKRQVFYCFHYANDVRRVQQIRNMGVIEGNTPVSPNEWEQLERSGDAAIERWIDSNMRYRSCVIVLIGSDTASRRWVKYEIEKAWNDGKNLLGIYIHNLKDPITGKCLKGKNPFSEFKIGDKNLADIVPCIDPNPDDAYNDINDNLSIWIETAIRIRNHYK